MVRYANRTTVNNEAIDGSLSVDETGAGARCEGCKKKA